MSNKRIGGIIEVKVNGDLYSAKGNFTYNLGLPKREMVIGADSVHGFKEIPQESFIEGAITDNADLSLAKLVQLKDATAILTLANGKVVVLREACYSGDGNVTTEEGEINFKLSGSSADEVRG